MNDEDTINYWLGRAIKIHRTLQHYTQNEFCERVEISQGFLSMLESNKANRRLDPAILERIAKNLGLKLSELIDYAENKCPLEDVAKESITICEKILNESKGK